MGDKRISITVSLPEDKRKALNELAVKTGIPVAAIVRNLVYERLKEV